MEELLKLIPAHTKNAIRTKLRRMGVSNDCKWTTEEIDIIKTNHNLLAKDIAKLLGNKRTEIAICKKLVKLGFKKRNPNPWTPEEIGILENLGSTTFSTELADLIPNHPPHVIAGKCNELGITKDEECRSRLGKYGQEYVKDQHYKLDQNLKLDDLNDTTYQVLIGSILGDGCVSYAYVNGTNCIFEEGHGIKQRDYVIWKSKLLKIFEPNYYDTCTPHMSTASHPIFTLLRQKFYGQETEKNLIPIEFLDRFSLFGLLIWYLDDGYLGRNEAGLKPSGRIRRTYPLIIGKGYNYVDFNNASTFINTKLQLTSYLLQRPHRGGMNKLLCLNNDKNSFMPLWQKMAIEYELPECMYYKLNMHNKKTWEPEPLRERKEAI